MYRTKGFSVQMSGVRALGAKKKSKISLLILTAGYQPRRSKTFGSKADTRPRGHSRFGVAKARNLTPEHCSQRTMLISAATPKARMTKPEILLIHASLRSLILRRKILVAPLKINHQVPEPKKTPMTISPADEY